MLRHYTKYQKIINLFAIVVSTFLITVEITQAQNTEIDGNLILTDSATHQIEIHNDGSGGKVWRVSSSKNSWNAGGGKFLINNRSNSNFSKFIITDDGNVGIGELNPLSKFSVNGKINVGNDILTPQQGDLRFNNTTNDFEGYSGTVWNSLSVPDRIENLDGNSSVRVWENATSDYIRFTLDGDERMRFFDNSNNVPRMEIYGTGNNIAIGDDAGMILTSANGENVLIGHLAGKGISDGEKNVFMGFKAGTQANYDENVGVGYEALQTVGKDAAASNTGRRNTAMGGYAGWRVNEGYDNVMVGHESGVNIREGYSNTFIGYGSGNAVISGHHNTAVGRNAGSATIERMGNYNTNVGESAGFNASGDFNVRIGRDAGRNNDGDANVFIGKEAGYDIDGDNKLVIGNDLDKQLIYGEFDNNLVRVGGDLETEDGSVFMRNLGSEDTDQGIKWGESTNTPVFGIVYDGQGTGVADKIHIREYNSTTSDIMTFEAGGDVGINTTTPDYDLDVNGTVRGTNVVCGSTSICSDLRFKNDIRRIQSPLSKVLRLKGYTHYWKSNKEFADWNFEEDRQLGFIAQEVQEIVPELVQVINDEGHLSVEYGKMTPLLVEAMKEQQVVIESQKLQLEKQQKLILDLERRMANLESYGSN